MDGLLPVLVAIVGLAGIVVNERFGNGVGAWWLGIQITTWMLGAATTDSDLSTLLLTISAVLAFVGFAFLWYKGPRRFTKALLPGVKG